MNANELAQKLSTMAKLNVHDEWARGLLDDDAVDAYNHVYTLHHSDAPAWHRELPVTTESQAIARELVRILPSGRAYC